MEAAAGASPRRCLRTGVRRQSLLAAGTQHRQVPRRPVSLREAPGHPRREGPRPQTLSTGVENLEDIGAKQLETKIKDFVADRLA